MLLQHGWQQLIKNQINQSIIKAVIANVVGRGVLLEAVWEMFWNLCERKPPVLSLYEKCLLRVAPFLHQRGALSRDCVETNHSFLSGLRVSPDRPVNSWARPVSPSAPFKLAVTRRVKGQGSEFKEWKASAPDRQASNGAQVAQQPPDSLFELREAGHRVGRLKLAWVVQPGL